MPFEISGRTSFENSVPRYEGDAAAAKTHLDKLQGHLEARLAQGKTGVLRLVVCDDKVTFERKSWWQFWARTDSQMKLTADYISSIIEKAYPSIGSSEGSSTETTKVSFLKYLADKKNRVGTRTLATKLKKLRAQDAARSPTTIAQVTFPREVEKVDDLGVFLQLKGMKFGSHIGAGNFGDVYDVKIAGSKERYVYKKEKKGVLLTRESLGPKWWRQGDMAAARLKDIPHMARPQFFILQVQVSQRHAKQLYYVPADQAKAFGEKLRKNFPDVKVILLGQLIAKAPGKELFKLLYKHRNIFPPESADFKSIHNALGNFLEQAHPHNLVHRDLKPENIIYDPATKTTTIIDLGLASRLAKRGKTTTKAGEGLTNPMQSKRKAGTRIYAAPAIFKGTPYRSEADFYSAALVLLELVSKEDFEKFTKQREQPPSTFTLFKERSPYTLDFYLNKISGLTGRSETKTALDKNPELKKIINLMFQVSEGGEKGETVFQQWRKAFNEYQKPPVLVSA